MIVTLKAFAVCAILGASCLTAQAADKVVRIGYQKYGTLILLKAAGSLEAKLKPLGYAATWTEFPAGPQLLEALNAGAIDFGSTGEAPPIFAQAAGAPLAYVANEPPAPEGEAILVPKNSPIKTVADLKGKSVALNKGSNVHYLLIRALEQSGVPYADIKPVYLTPADARAAFERGSVDAWAIWDPYYAAGQAGTDARVLVNGVNLVPNVQFYLATRELATNDAPAVDAIIAALDAVDKDTAKNTDAAAASLSAAIHVPAPIITTALKRQTYGVTRIHENTMADQQRIADAFALLGLLPKPIRVSDALVRKP